MDIHLSSWLRKRGLLLTVQPFESETRRQAAILGVAKDLSECGEQQAAAFLEKEVRRGDDVGNEGEEIGNLVLHFSPSHEQEPGVRLTVRCANLAVNQASNFDGLNPSVVPVTSGSVNLVMMVTLLTP